MADFVQVMNDWARMCASMQGGIAKCDNCPLFKVLCQYRPNEKVDFVGAEKIIEEWAEDNPAPVYPTWGEWFVEHGDLVDGWQNATNAAWIANTALSIFMKPIPADIAQKLGIEPKEDV